MGSLDVDKFWRLKGFMKWKALQPDGQAGECCDSQHYIYEKKATIWVYTRAKPDCDVCDRERLWREYVRERDGTPRWMPS